MNNELSHGLGLGPASTFSISDLSAGPSYPLNSGMSDYTDGLGKTVEQQQQQVAGLAL